MVDQIRASEATGAVLGLWNVKMEARPTTGYLMTYHGNGCSANCKFCPQARTSESDPEKLSRVSWPRKDFEKVRKSISENREKLRRICVQALNYSGVVEDLCEIVKALKKDSDLPISVSCQPLDEEDMRELKKSGVDRLGIPLDAANPHLFDMMKGQSAGGPYTWEAHIEALKQAVDIFGDGVSTHLIVGLGEAECELIRLIQFLHDEGITVGLFALTPVEGSDIGGEDRPEINKYRRIQLAHHLITEDISQAEEMEFENGSVKDFGTDREKLEAEIDSGIPFKTTGCPGCNRPFYNESPGGPIYNYPREPSREDLEKIKKQLGPEITGL